MIKKKIDPKIHRSSTSVFMSYYVVSRSLYGQQGPNVGLGYSPAGSGQCSGQPGQFVFGQFPSSITAEHHKKLLQHQQQLQLVVREDG